MAPTIPFSLSPRGNCAAAAISISSSESDPSFTNTLIVLSSATYSTSSVVIVRDSSASRGGDEARRGQRSALPHRRPPSLAPSALPVRSSTVVTAASSANGSGHAATTAAAPHQCPSPCSVFSVRAPGGVVPTPPSSGGRGGDDDDEATSRLKRKAQYRKWRVEDELKILSTLAKLRKDNLGVPPQASVLLKKICEDGGLLRRGVDATELSDKVFKLKKKFMKAAAKVAASNGRHLRKYRNRVLYKTSMEAWPDLLPVDAAAAVQGL
ncbi:hypothetical protein BDA96_08G078100 [Sorghum bicolor]|jgi:hypothetical protein|uniref:Glabrous enhancer-binding protein-like DBD domain-containing protein n=2 Tax=Sorghum bicolor TaxID=4558 RepID=A0A921U6R6_SORBI|nr:uncharacterized protein LOC8155666 [Sorghum bicolor]KAG0520483.1 hypothetical protein BDA96_08G078100 [Sorghum bicolor]OQU91912.1 hypothetical protein SORBI_3001G261513 [Sorghum bicolor]|eukprot:XP_021318244.1 uncharacterized protein LOC8155666 [Sorghum bicolor]